MRVLFLTNCFSNVVDGGEPRSIWQLANMLAKKGIEIYIPAPYVEILDAVPHPNIKVYQLPFSGKKTSSLNQVDSFKTFLYSLPIVFFKKIDIIHLITTQEPHPFARFKVRPYVSVADLTWNYNDSKFKEDLLYDRRRKKEETGMIKGYNLGDKILGKIAHYFFKFFKINDSLPKSVDLYICRHLKMLARLKSENYSSRLVYIPAGIDIDEYNPQVEPVAKEKNNFTFLFAGKIAKRKGVEYILRAFNILSQKYNNVELLLIGRGAPDTINFFKQIAEKKDKVKFIHDVFAKDLIPYYTYADVFVAPAIGTPFGFYQVHLEAMSCGTPLIVSKKYDTKLIHKKVGLTVKAGDVISLAEAMEELVQSPSLVKSMGTEARKYAVKNFDWSCLADKMIRAYGLILKEKKN